MEDGNTRLADISEHLSLRRRSRRCRSCPRCYKLRPTDIPALSGALPSATALNRDRDVSRTSVQPRQHFYRYQDRPYDAGRLGLHPEPSSRAHARSIESAQSPCERSSSSETLKLTLKPTTPQRGTLPAQEQLPAPQGKSITALAC